MSGVLSVYKMQLARLDMQRTHFETLNDQQLLQSMLNGEQALSIFGAKRDIALFVSFREVISQLVDSFENDPQARWEELVDEAVQDQRDLGEQNIPDDLAGFLLKLNPEKFVDVSRTTDPNQDSGERLIMTKDYRPASHASVDSQSVGSSSRVASPAPEFAECPEVNDFDDRHFAAHLEANCKKTVKALRKFKQSQAAVEIKRLTPEEGRVYEAISLAMQSSLTASVSFGSYRSDRYSATQQEYLSILREAKNNISTVSRQTANAIMENNGKTFSCWDGVVGFFFKNHKAEKALKLEIERVEGLTK